MYRSSTRHDEAFAELAQVTGGVGELQACQDALAARARAAGASWAQVADALGVTRTPPTSVTTASSLTAGHARGGTLACRCDAPSTGSAGSVAPPATLLPEACVPAL